MGKKVSVPIRIWNKDGWLEDELFRFATMLSIWNHQTCSHKYLVSELHAQSLTSSMKTTHFLNDLASWKRALILFAVPPTYLFWRLAPEALIRVAPNFPQMKVTSSFFPLPGGLKYAHENFCVFTLHQNYDVHICSTYPWSINPFSFFPFILFAWFG